MSRLLSSALLCAALLGVAVGPARAWSQAGGELVLPVLDDRSGEVQALLVLEDLPAATLNPLDRVIGPNPSRRAGALELAGTSAIGRLRADIGLERGGQLALLCSGASPIHPSFVGLNDQCLLASIGDADDLLRAAPAPALGSRIALDRERVHVEARFGLGRYDLEHGQASLQLPGARNPATAGALDAIRVEGASFSVGAAFDIGDEGWVSIGGTRTRARLVAPDAFGPLAQQWNTTSLGLSAGLGDFSGSLVGRSIELPGLSPQYTGLDVGLTWRTPWRARLTIGAEGLGGEPLPWLPAAPGNAEPAQTRTVPYVRYEQDL
jgi:hypothetical protein